MSFPRLAELSPSTTPHARRPSAFYSTWIFRNSFALGCSRPDFCKRRDIFIRSSFRVAFAADASSFSLARVR